MVILFFIRSIREVWIQIFKVLVSSFAVFIIISAFLIISCYAAYILFGSPIEETIHERSPLYTSFDDLPSSLYTVFQMFTMSNYPDIEIPFFKDNRMSAIYFVV